MKKTKANQTRFPVRTAVLTSIFAIISTVSTVGQSPSPNPTPEEALYNGYRLSASIEAGWRWRTLDGNENQYRSALNYKQGFRTFDTNILLETDNGKGKWFDSLLISNTGWGSDPTGFTRVSMEKTGFYKFDATARRVNYFNNISTHVLGQHNQNTQHNFSDFDLTILPQNEKLRFTVGASFNSNTGPGGWTVRAYSDEYPVTTNTKAESYDLRFGVEGKALGFDWGITQGLRNYNDRSYYELLAPAPGNNTTNTAALATYSRLSPVQGHAYFTQFNLHRTFASKLDMTGRLIYSSTNTRSQMIEKITGRDNSNNFVDLDLFQISGDAKRPQTRGDLGLTLHATDNFRISNTFTLDKFSVNGGENFEEQLYRRNAAGNPLATTLTRSKGYRVNDYERLVNTIEADYQFGNRVGVHAGYRFTKRRVNVTGFDQTLTSPPSATNPNLISEEEENSTNTLLAGMKIKPVKNWVIFWDVEHGSADNVFTRIENYKFTNFRARSRVTLNKFAFNVSVISKDNNNPSKTIDVPPLDFGTDIKTRNISTSIDWTPISELSISGGYTRHNLTSDTPIRVPVGSNIILQGVSQFYMRDNYGYIEVAAKPHKRVSFFATYRLSRDKGQGDRVSTGVQNIIASYPMEFKTPEFRMAVRLSRNVDWNVGYQYYDYKDTQTPTQNYRAHLPYTSLRIYFGGKAADR